MNWIKANSVIYKTEESFNIFVHIYLKKSKAEGLFLIKSLSKY